MDKDVIRASALKNAILSYFIIPKSYFINYTIPFYNTSYIPKLYYFTFSLKYYFFIFLYYFFPIITFFSANNLIPTITFWNNIYIYIYLEYCHSTILKLELYCSTIAKFFAIMGFTIFWCKRFWAMKCQKVLRYGISILQC